MGLPPFSHCDRFVQDAKTGPGRWSMAEKKLKIGEILVAAGVIKEEQLTEALRSQSQLGGTLGENLIRLAFLTEEELLKSLSDQLGMQHINLTKVEVPAAVQRLGKRETVRP